MDQVGALGRRCPWPRPIDHGHVNRQQGSQRRVVIGEPIVGRLRERDPLSGFCTSTITLANRLVLKDRMPVEIGKPDGQRDQFAAEVEPAICLFPLLVIVNQFCLLLRAAPGISVLVPWAQFFGDIHLPLLIAIRASFLKAPPGDGVGGGYEGGGHTVVKFGMADTVEQQRKSNQSEYFVVE
jgi:hypothetical protein